MYNKSIKLTAAVIALLAVIVTVINSYRNTGAKTISHRRIEEKSPTSVNTTYSRKCQNVVTENKLASVNCGLCNKNMKSNCLSNNWSGVWPVSATYLMTLQMRGHLRLRFLLALPHRFLGQILLYNAPLAHLTQRLGALSKCHFVCARKQRCPGD